VIPEFKNGRIDNIYISYKNKLPEVPTRARIDILTAPWLRYSTENIPGIDNGTPNFFVTVKGVSDNTGVGKDGYTSQTTKKLESSGKMDW